jgi:hybrid cluster-associated redox disulfide protein
LRQRKDALHANVYTLAAMNIPEETPSDFSLSQRMLMADLMSAWPQVIPVLLARRMACVGCDMARFETLADAARIYGLDLQKLMADLNRVIENSNPNIPISEEK